MVPSDKNPSMSKSKKKKKSVDINVFTGKKAIDYLNSLDMSDSDESASDIESSYVISSDIESSDVNASDIESSDDSSSDSDVGYDDKKAEENYNPQKLYHELISTFKKNISKNTYQSKKLVKIRKLMADENTQDSDPFLFDENYDFSTIVTLNPFRDKFDHIEHKNDVYISVKPILLKKVKGLNRYSIDMSKLSVRNRKFFTKLNDRCIKLLNDSFYPNNKSKKFGGTVKKDKNGNITANFQITGFMNKYAKSKFGYKTSLYFSHKILQNMMHRNGIKLALYKFDYNLTEKNWVNLNLKFKIIIEPNNEFEACCFDNMNMPNVHKYKMLMCSLDVEREKLIKNVIEENKEETKKNQLKEGTEFLHKYQNNMQMAI
jgi:uncharacterized protein (DUF1697 family)